VKALGAVLVVAACVPLAGTRRAAAEPVPLQAAPPPASGGKPSPSTSRAERVDPRLERLAKAAEEARAANRLDEAVRLYQDALQVEPGWTEGRWALGTVLYSLERFEEARDAFRRVAGQKPADAATWAFKGLCEYELRSYDRAISDLQRAQLLGLPNKELYHVAAYHLGTLYTRYEQFEASLQQLARLAREGNESTSMAEALGLSILRLPFLPFELPPQKREMVLMAGRATNHWANARRPAAQRAFEELLLRYPEEKNVHYAFGVFLLKEDQDGALAQFQRELQISPFHVEAMLQIALEKNLRAEQEEALSHARKAVEIAPRNAAARNILGQVLLGKDDVEGAIQNLEEGVKIAPLSRQMRFELARAYARAGRTEEAARQRDEFRRLEAAERARKSDQPLGEMGLDEKSATPGEKEAKPN
jgi:tetratricopeptide (TPR) repeat protein